MKLGVTEYVDSAHFLPGHPKCGPLHGHTYKVEIVIEGKTTNGMVIDFADLKRSLREVLATELETHCRALCFGPFPSWAEVQARLEEIRSLL